MKLFEFEGKSLFKKTGIPVPEGDVAVSAEEAGAIADRIGFPVVLKSQILGGGRGKAGGIFFAKNQEDVSREAEKLFGMTIAEEAVKKILVEEKIAIASEFYMGITLDLKVGLPVLMVSDRGGVDIESVAEEAPQALHRVHLDPDKTLRLYHAVDLISKTGLTGKVLTSASGVLLKLVECYFRYEAMTAEINPLIIDADSRVLAADSKFEIDDSARFRQPEVNAFVREKAAPDPLEAEAIEAGVSYVRMAGGSIGLISGGAGLGMASMDMIKNHGGEPANFLDLSGNATPERTAAALKVVLKTPGVEGVLVNLFGGINNCEQMAKGIAQVVDELKPAQAIAVKMRGHSQEEGWEILEKRKIPIVKYGTTEEAVVMLLDTMKKKGTG
jgi:succinyl-CoA synthetase beta subunit